MVGSFANSNWPPDPTGHFTFFSSLPIAMVSLYFLAKRWAIPTVALIATLLFATQPLIFGHAFINPKDLPFLTFFLASVALGVRMAQKSVRLRSVRILLAGLILLPGILGIIRLHPYKYIYYNSLVGGVRGAYRLYQLDYWDTFLKESLEIVNEIASPNSSVYINGPWENIWEFAREDLRLYDAPENAFDPNQTHYVMASTRGSEDVPFRRFGDVVHEIMIDGATLSTVFITARVD